MLADASRAGPAAYLGKEGEALSSLHRLQADEVSLCETTGVGEAADGQDRSSFSMKTEGRGETDKMSYVGFMEGAVFHQV